MVTLPLTAVAVCLFISAVEPQDFTIHTENSRINVTVGGNAFLSVRPSAETINGSWNFEGTDIAVWVGANGGPSNNYKSWAELFLPNGSLLLKSVTASDSGAYTVTMRRKTGTQASATINLHVHDQTNGENNTSSGAIAGIVIAALLIVCFISGITAWLVKRKGGRTNDRMQGENTANINSTVNDISATVGENSAGTYENIPRKQKDGAPKPLDENSTYMGLQLQDQAVYNDLMRR